MNKAVVLVLGASLTLWGCGSGDEVDDAGAKQSELADLLLEQSEGVGFSQQCVRDKTADLSEDDAQFLIDNIDASDTEGFSSELQAWADGLIECLDDPAIAEASDETEATEPTVPEETESTEATVPEETETTEATVPEETETTEPTVPEETEATEPTDAVGDSDSELASIGKSGFSTWDNGSGETWASAGALINNNSDQDLFGTEVTFNFIGADGVPVATESTYLEVIPAGDSFPVQIGTYTDLTEALPITVEITAYAELDSFWETDWVELELGAATINPDEYFSTVSGTVTNPGDESFDFYELTCLIVDADGAVVGGAFTFPDRVAPGQTIAWEASVDDGPIQAGGVDAECRSIATIS